MGIFLILPARLNSELLNLVFLFLFLLGSGPALSICLPLGVVLVVLFLVLVVEDLEGVNRAGLEAGLGFSCRF